MMQDEMGGLNFMLTMLSIAGFIVAAAAFVVTAAVTAKANASAAKSISTATQEELRQMAKGLQSLDILAERVLNLTASIEKVAMLVDRLHNEHNEMLMRIKILENANNIMQSGKS